MSTPLSPLSMNIVLLAVFGLIGVGLYGLLITRNLIKVVMVLQILVKGAVLALVLAGHYSGQLMVSESLAATVIVADTMVAVVALAMAVQIRRLCGSIDVTGIARLKG